MQINNVLQETWADEVGKRHEILLEDFADRDLVAQVCFLHPAQKALESAFAFVFLDLLLHLADIGTEREALSIGEPQVIIWLAFQ